MDPLVLEHLVTLNRSVVTAIDILRKLAEYPGLKKKESFLAAPAYFREHLSDANVFILEALHQTEELAGGIAYKERRAYETATRDPDDCYFEVMQREKERHQQGLPSRIGISFESDGDAGEKSTESGDSEDLDPEGEERRRRIIARVDALRTERMMTSAEFDKLIGPSAAASWRLFASLEGHEGWKHATPQMFDKIARLFEIDDDDASLEFLR